MNGFLTIDVDYINIMFIISSNDRVICGLKEVSDG